MMAPRKSPPKARAVVGCHPAEQARGRGPGSRPGSHLGSSLRWEAAFGVHSTLTLERGFCG